MLNNMIKTITQNWNLLRLIRLLLGVMIIVQSVGIKDYLFGSIGLLFAVMTLLNIGCCSTGVCSTNLYSEKSTNDSKKETTYEEVV